MNARFSPPEVMERLLSPGACCGVVQVMAGWVGTCTLFEDAFEEVGVEFICWAQAVMVSRMIRERIKLRSLTR